MTTAPKPPPLLPPDPKPCGYGVHICVAFDTEAEAEAYAQQTGGQVVSFMPGVEYAEWVMNRRRAPPSPAPAPDVPPVDEGELWSLIRRVLSQGHAQQEDYRAGKYNKDGGYEAFSARVDLAARERVPQFLALLSGRAVVVPAPDSQEKGK